jgi:transcriptional regulator with XRE-family HTH domain
VWVVIRIEGGVFVVGPGNRLRLLREQLGFTLRDVENCSIRLAERHKNEEYAIPLSRLSEIETKGLIPTPYRMYSLAVIYRLDYNELLGWYGIDITQVSKDLSVAEPRRTHRVDALTVTRSVEIPVKVDPSFDPRRTGNLGRMIEKWGIVPLSKLHALRDADYTYGYIGTEDFTMYPLLLPGTFIQVDESKNEVVEGVWRSEYERPIYFIETRQEYICSWCSIKDDEVILQPHPLSPVPVRVMRYPQEAEVIGRVVGFAMRLDEFSAPANLQETKARAKLN